MQQLSPNSLLKGGTYKIERTLGQGSFGITYLATHTALDKKVAIKEFFMKELNGRGEDGSITGMSDGSLSQNYAQKFKKEALNLARLEHPNIVRVTDSFEDNGTFYYVMEYIEGENLNDYVKHCQLSQQEAVAIIRSVAEALRYMHEEKHMLHLDLKPGNVMRRASDGHIFLIDFGLSKHYSNDGQPETSTTIGLGTVGYAPIEQVNQIKNGEFRPTIDVYALGATFYKLLTRETPPAASELVSDDEMLAEKLQKHNVENILADIVVKAMQPNVKKRLQCVRDFLDKMVFEQEQSNTPEEAEETIIEEEIEPIDETPKSRNGIFIVAFLFIVAFVVGLLYFRSSSSNSDAKPVDSVAQKSDSAISIVAIDTANTSSNKKKVDNSVTANEVDKTPSTAKSEKTTPDSEKPATTTKKTKDGDNASLLRRAISSNDYQTVQRLANQGYAAAYGPLARYYLDNHEYKSAETYAKKAKSAGYSEGKRVLSTLENLGYYD